jgi:hypothetical protein
MWGERLLLLLSQNPLEASLWLSMWWTPVSNGWVLHWENMCNLIARRWPKTTSPGAVTLTC